MVRQHRTGTRPAFEEREDHGKVHGVRDSFSRATLLRATCSAAESRSASDSTAGNRVSGWRVSSYRARDRADRCGTFGATGTPVSVIPRVVSTEFAVARSPSVRRWRLQASRQFRAQNPSSRGRRARRQTPSHPQAHADNPLRLASCAPSEIGNRWRTDYAYVLARRLGYFHFHPPTQLGCSL